MIAKLIALLPVPAAGLVAYGVWSIYQPAGYITLGAALFLLELRYDTDDDEGTRP